jgi:hypothetical protein
MAAPLDLVIVSYNACEDLRNCLRSLRGHPPSRDVRLVVVDNASTDRSVAVASEEWPGALVLPQAENLGFARANNLGIRAGTSPLVLLLNGDTVVPAGAIDALVAALEEDPAAAAAGPRLVDADGLPELSFGRMISPWNELQQKLIGRWHARGVPAVRNWVRRRTSRRHYPDWVSGACLLVRRGDAEAAGLFDERFFMYTEDVDFCAALRARGRRVLFTPAAEVVHLRGRSGQSAPAATASLYRRSQVAFYEKHHPGWAPWLKAYLSVRGVPVPPAGV